MNQPRHPRIILGTRGSELALRQTEMVTAMLRERHPHLLIERKVIATAGDKRPDLRFSEFSKGAAPILDKGIFIKELESALAAGEIDAAVHSLKDVPSELSPAFAIAAVLPRAAIEDVLITREPQTLASLPKGARVGTSSVRRARQLRWLRPDLEAVEIRGNVPTRVRKVLGDGGLDAVLLAAAGLLRLGLLNANLSRLHLDDRTVHALVLDESQFLPAAGQGAIAIETRADDQGSRDIAASINHPETFTRISAEREFLRLLKAGCQTPVGVRTWIHSGALHMAVRVFSETDETAPPIQADGNCPASQPLQIAAQLAETVLNQA